eukprot:Phypoly_transcript_10922.p1 GENE.Phypoly_transcript_10922~~Phypoly_transcript_10922.p1  ORF type:complete len:192 (+),score=22.75 Phypoly_transcript_10922:90-665(+)
MCGGKTGRLQKEARRKKRLALQNSDGNKVVIVGDSGAGKTSIMMRLVDNTFDPTRTTTGIDSMTKIANLGDKTVKLQIWDTAGQERFSTITPSFFRGAIGAIVVYDITNKASFDNVWSWMHTITDSAMVPCRFVIGNKTDLQSTRVVKTSEGQELADTMDYIFMEVSAKSGENIGNLFTNLAGDVYKWVSR